MFNDSINTNYNLTSPNLLNNSKYKMLATINLIYVYIKYTKSNRVPTQFFDGYLMDLMDTIKPNAISDNSMKELTNLKITSDMLKKALQFELYSETQLIKDLEGLQQAIKNII